MILLCCATTSIVCAIQVHEHVDNDLTTATTTLLTSTAAQPAAEADEATGTTSAMYASSTTEQPLTTNAVLSPINTTKQPRVVHGSKSGSASFHGDQQPRSTTNVNSQSQFVPSPQLSPMAFPPISSSSSAERARENVVQPLQNIHLHYPASYGVSSQLHIQPTHSTTSTTTSASSAYLPKYYKPAADNLIFGEPDRDPWRLSGPAMSSPSYQYPITSNGGLGGGGKWYWMPNSLGAPTETAGQSPPVLLQPTTTQATSPFASDVLGQQPHWRWMFDQKYPAEAGPEAGGYPSFAQRPSTPDFQRGNDHPYSFDPPAGPPQQPPPLPPQQRPPRPFPTTLTSTPYGVLSGEEQGGPFATQISETEYTRLVKGPPPLGALGTLSGEQQQLTKPKSKECVPLI